MKLHNRSKFFGNVLSNGSFIFVSLSNNNSQRFLKVNNIDIINHSAWTGRRPKEQTEISAFIGAIYKI